MVDFSPEQIEQLKTILIRERATALGELRSSQSLYGAYTHRPAIVAKVDEAQKRYDIVNDILKSFNG